MLTGKISGTSGRADVYVDLLASASGLFLASFVWIHMLFVSTILLGGTIFNYVPLVLDETYISYVGIFMVIVAILLHLVAAGRRIPTRFQEQRIVWRHARSLGHRDTWLWLVQIVTGMSILILASIHIWMVLYGWPITTAASAGRIQTGMFWLYLILLPIAELHTGIGVYRIFIKWGWVDRHKVNKALNVVTLVILGLGLASLLVFLFLISSEGAL